MILRRLLLAALLVAPACGPKGMKKIEIPAAGIRMTYDLDAGAIYEGKLRIGNTPTSSNITQSVECDVRLEVLGDDPERGGKAVRASFANIELQWGLPASATVTESDFTREAILQLERMNVTFNVLPTGEITYMPVPPQQLADELKVLIDQVLLGLEEGFLVVPKHAVKRGETWSDDERRGRKDTLGRYVEAKLTTKVDGLYRHEELGQDVVRLVIGSERRDTFTTEDGARTSESQAESTVLFSTEGYLAKVDGESRDQDPVQGVSFRKVSLAWKKTADGTPGARGSLTPVQEQEITDPCDPDYVGAEECKQAPPVEAPPAEETPPEPAPAE
jgi:hypothetical protein